jgi:hypothetical protein
MKEKYKISKNWDYNDFLVYNNYLEDTIKNQLLYNIFILHIKK